jgi:hypothetical protein
MTLESPTVLWTPDSSGHLWLEDKNRSSRHHHHDLERVFSEPPSTARLHRARILIAERPPLQRTGRRAASFNAHSSGLSERLSSIHL